MISIVESKFIKSAVKPSGYHPTSYVEIAVVGKSNVGKSSLINTLLNRRNIAKVSSSPGKTKQINFFEVRFKAHASPDAETEKGFFSLADLPGYGYAKVSKKEKDRWKAMVEDYFEHRVPLRAVIMLVDIRHLADPKDIKMIELLNYYQIPFLVIANKADKIPKNRVPKQLSHLAEGLSVNPECMIAFSALKKNTLPDLLAALEEIIL